MEKSLLKYTQQCQGDSVLLRLFLTAVAMVTSVDKATC